jgi:uncharacterized membrane protein YeaQ/YmgE (transglycosylase-associated protein family)
MNKLKQSLQIACFLISTAHGQEISHISVGANVGALSSAIFGKNPDHRIFIGTFSGLIAGIGKEVYDNSRKAGSAEFSDIVNSAIGGMIGGAIVHVATRKRVDKKRKKNLVHKM